MVRDKKVLEKETYIELIKELENHVAAIEGEIETLEKEKIKKNILNLIDTISELPEDVEGYQELSNKVDNKKRELQNELSQISMKIRILSEYKKYFIKEEQ